MERERTGSREGCIYKTERIRVRYIHHKVLYSVEQKGKEEEKEIDGKSGDLFSTIFLFGVFLR